MTIYIKFDVDLTAATDSDYKNIFWKKTDDVLNQILRSDLTVHESGTIRLAASEPTYTVPMGKVVTGNVLFMSALQETDVFIDGSATPVTIKPLSSYRGFIALHGEFTAVVISNMAAVASDVEYFIAGLTT